MIGVEEHAWTPELRDALLHWGGDDTVDLMSSQADVDARLRELGDERLRRMDRLGVDMQVLSVTTPGTQPLRAAEAVPLARDANDALLDATRRHPDRFAAFATLPTPDPDAAAIELDRVVRAGMVGAMLFPRTGEDQLDHPRFRPVFESAAELGVPIYLHPGVPPRAVRASLYDGFDPWVSMLLATGGWGWHAEAGVAVLRLILAGTFDRHPDLQVVLGHWGEQLVSFADRADLLSGAAGLERPVLEQVTDHVHVSAGGVMSHRMMRAALDVLGADRVMYGHDDPYGAGAAGQAGADSRGRYGGRDGARLFVEEAPLSDPDKARLAHVNAERLLGLAPVEEHS
ncbi:amidohydrolase [Marmoricola endophyticus]|uniref:Amidohydrolase n=1 Tax=Marmoricola endophyticus TaxID=2040280 RepID=A0A917F3L5_9ACTN|nr:amidohydrolase [Marmoricola endophyticus]